jgi:Periplasmic binding protein
MARFRRLGVVMLVLAALLAACSESSDDDAGGDGEETQAPDDGGGAGTGGDGTDSTVGITADTITLSTVSGDTQALQDAGVIPVIGDVPSYFELFAERANEEGGAAGRELVVTKHEFPVPGDATQQREACVAATEDDQAFIVAFVGGQVEETALCVTEEHETIAVGLTGNARQSTYAASDGRLFLNDMSSTRLMGNWVTAVDEQGILDDATIGIIRPDDTAHQEIAEQLTAELEAAGYEVTEDVALPCDPLGQSCEQSDVGVQRLQTGGVDTVFSLLGALAYPSVVGAADAAGYDPQWLASDYETQVYDATAGLFEGNKEAFDGAIGISTTVAIDDPDEPRAECNEYYESQGGEPWEPLSDGWQAVGSMCHLVDRIVEAANAAEEAGGLNQASFIEEYEKIPPVEGERRGVYGPDKHDGYDTYQLYEFSAECTCWEPIEGTVATDES